ncbi:hypothetical protein PALB_27170 [Pseudoalteromonas luteoviolacea B = ATCC 29581]|nr:hypothetical protein PALB_27170 [Pseudoalteromonas luteoviolacea B = ATCC 29581]
MIRIRGKIYSGYEQYDELVIYKGKVIFIGSQHQGEHSIKSLNMNSVVEEIVLKPEQCVVPGFILPKIDLGTGLTVSNWLHLGPFGMHGAWHHPIPNYNLNYLAKAITYFDRSLRDNNWLLGYGLDLNLLSCLPWSEKRDESFLTFIDGLKLARPVCIFEKSGKKAFINTLAATAIFLNFTELERAFFPDLRSFIRFIETEKGIRSSHFEWFTGAVEEGKVSDANKSIILTLDRFKAEALKWGITSFGINEPPSLYTLIKQHFYPINVVNTEVIEQNDDDILFVYPDNNDFDGYYLRQKGSLDRLKTHLSLHSRRVLNRLVCGCEFPNRPLGTIRFLKHVVKCTTLIAPDEFNATQRSLLSDEKLTIKDALCCMTVNAGSLLNKGGVLGTLNIGANADFLVLSHDLIAFPETLDALCIEQTWIAGECRYENENLRSNSLVNG